MMKKAFSLIEIMQTVVLLGIIAGLSISFFKRFSSNYKLYNSTTKQLQLAIQEANRRMCNDTTPYCRGWNVSWKMANNNPNIFKSATCEEVYSGSHYNEKLARCEASAGSCPPVNNDYDGLVPLMVKDPTGVCYAYPTCIHRKPKAGGFENEAVETQPYSDIICPNGKPDYSKAKAINDQENTQVSALCWYLHDILSHKKQGLDDTDDIRRTCQTDKTVIAYNNIVYDNASPELTTEKMKDIAEDKVRGLNGLTSYNMLLPNGVRLYNLGGTFQKGSNIYVYIKYDKTADIKTSVYVENNPEASTVGVMKITNPTAAAASSSPYGLSFVISEIRKQHSYIVPAVQQICSAQGSHLPTADEANEIAKKIYEADGANCTKDTYNGQPRYYNCKNEVISRQPLRQALGNYIWTQHSLDGDSSKTFARTFSDTQSWYLAYPNNSEVSVLCIKN